MDKLTEFQGSPIQYVETTNVKDGVVCDVYEFSEDKKRDLAIVRVAKGSKTPLQKVVEGTETIEGYFSGSGTLTLIMNGVTKSYNFNPGDKGEIVVNKGDVMQWRATDGDLEFYELCTPPFADGRFENIHEE